MIVNKRKHDRLIIQHSSKSGILDEKFLHLDPLMNLKPTITNISFGGLGLIFFPQVEPEPLKQLISGKSNLVFEFHLPPSIKKIHVTGKLKWVSQKNILGLPISLGGIEFVTKTQDLYREIDNFIKSPSPRSELLKNRRFFPRIPLKLRTHLYIPGVKKYLFVHKQFEGNIFNLSALGAMIACHPCLSDKELLQLKSSGYLTIHFFLPSSNKQFVLKVRPVYLKKIKERNSEFTSLGVKFIQLTPKEKQDLVEFITVKKILFLKSELEQESRIKN